MNDLITEIPKEISQRKHDWPDWITDTAQIDIPQVIAVQPRPPFTSEEARTKQQEGKQPFVEIPRKHEIDSNIFPRKTISILIPNWYKHPRVPSVFEKIACQNFPSDMYEVIFVDDNTRYLGDLDIFEIMEEMKAKYDDMNISFYETHKNITFNIALAYNIAAKRAKHDVVFNNDADSWQLSPNYLQTLSRYFTLFEKENTRVAVAPGIVSAREGKLIIDARPSHDTGLALRREDLWKIKGYDERFRGWRCNEPDFSSRVGFSGVAAGWTPDLLIGTIMGTWSYDLVGENKLILNILNEKQFIKLDYETKNRQINHLPPEWQPTALNAELHRENWTKRVFCPNKEWGELDTLERVF